MDKRRRNQLTAPSQNGQPRQNVAGPREVESLKRELLTVTLELETYREETRVQTEHLVKTREMLEKSRDRYADLFDFAPMPYVILDRWGVISETNLPAAALLQCERGRIVGFPLRRFVHPEDRRALLTHMYRCRNESGRIKSELRLVTGKGEHVPVELASRRALADAEGAELYPTAVEDLTERQRAVTVRNELLTRLMAAEENERHRLSRELHDVAGQHVTALILGLRALQNDVTESSRHRINELLSIADALGQVAHSLALDLRPTALDDLGLSSALTSYIDDWSTRSGIPTRFHALGVTGHRLPPHVETMFYRVAQEGLTNIAKHAKAHHVNVLLNIAANEAGLIVEDDGCGLDEQLVFENAARNKRLGLFGIRERVTLAGGTLHIESAPQRGTTLFVRVPAQTGRRGGNREAAQ